MVGKSVWGPAIWYLFHTLAFKMKNQHFNEMKNSLLDFFVLVSATFRVLNAQNMHNKKPKI